jgi:hypothetical protein
VERKVILLIDVPTHALVLIKPFVATPTTTCGANSVPPVIKRNYARGRVNRVAVEEAHEGPYVYRGMSLINATSTIVLFDSRASHSFISTTYVKTHNLPISLLKCQMIVSSLVGDMLAR